jgi:hypothetical protein
MIFTDIIKLRWVSIPLGWTHSNIMRFPYRKRRSRERQMRGESPVSMSHGGSVPISGSQRLKSWCWSWGWQGWTDIQKWEEKMEDSQEVCPMPHLHCRLLSSQTMTEYASLFLSYPVSVLCYSSPRKLTSIDIHGALCNASSVQIYIV